MSIDLSRLSAKELASLIRDAQKRKTVVSKRQPITKVRAQLVKAAQKAGYSIDELFGTGAPVELPGMPWFIASALLAAALLLAYWHRKVRG